ncbi:hypothetical protein P9743_04565 [Anoxybacillus geothermalis]|uniref:Uncharacterized protein n=1 Tax=Geobacillus zalihae TaxID=213419 RepID=A0A7H1RS62_9BACL|nr:MULTISPECIES: hypothetical protein [Geobacillus]MCG6794639.1 hypothetical protein [Geobacillus sp. YHL]MED4923511.1 hypothetical protein [Anoxybacillus geothermalis]QNU17101.1 hypothetical protein IC807_11685 [Geobacillus zalihae]
MKPLPFLLHPKARFIHVEEPEKVNKVSVENRTDAGKDAAGLPVDFIGVPSLIRWPKISFMSSVVRRLGKQLVLGKISHFAPSQRKSGGFFAPIVE